MSKKRLYVGAVIADIHWGAMPASRLSEELQSSFLDKLKEYKVLDYVIIAGDLFDSKLSLNSEHVKQALIFLNKLTKICIKKNAKLRIIKGTESHDNQQLDVLHALFDNDADIKIIGTVSTEELLPDLKVLYIPEEYMSNKDEYYKEYFDVEDCHYDMIFGHGMFGEVGSYAKEQTSEVTMAKAPVFSSKEMARIVAGGCFFGHIHISQSFRDKIYYTGSFTRWVFGEESDKGFIITSYCPEDRLMSTTFIKNELAPTYNTIRITISDNRDVSTVVDDIVRVISKSNAFKTRVIITIMDGVTNGQLIQDTLSNIISKQSNIKLIFERMDKDAAKKKENDEKIQALMKSYSFIFDKGTLPEEKLSLFISKAYNKHIPVEDIRRMLYETMRY